MIFAVCVRVSAIRNLGEGDTVALCIRASSVLQVSGLLPLPGGFVLLLYRSYFFLVGSLLVNGCVLAQWLASGRCVRYVLKARVIPSWVCLGSKAHFLLSGPVNIIGSHFSHGSVSLSWRDKGLRYCLSYMAHSYRAGRFHISGSLFFSVSVFIGRRASINAGLAVPIGAIIQFGSVNGLSRTGPDDYAPGRVFLQRMKVGLLGLPTGARKSKGRPKAS